MSPAPSLNGHCASAGGGCLAVCDGMTVRVNVVVCPNGDPVTVRVNVPGVVVVAADSVSWLVHAGYGVQDDGLNVALAPTGNPLIESATLWAVPWVHVAVMLVVALEPCWKLTFPALLRV